MASITIFAVLLLTTIIGTVLARPGHGGFYRHSTPIAYTSYSYPSYGYGHGLYSSYSYPSYGYGHGVYGHGGYGYGGYGHGGYGYGGYGGYSGYGLGGWLGDYW